MGNKRFWELMICDRVSTTCMRSSITAKDTATSFTAVLQGNADSTKRAFSARRLDEVEKEALQ
ncbi:hypothetical protein T4E_9971 [Trichinella pseudospiralis]|uniref:Uncharacterized protein n=1 Tax=Trichinella pseudospiralis TaxID=6337 RepID=A0A0V0XNM9_TRIPS|nr:hypothetical protein T4E_9971 [Trichinella pseudospiralis]KRY87335.1 hypothetical protein T4D_6802 [Trichinella pseudospiralis]